MDNHSAHPHHGHDHGHDHSGHDHSAHVAEYRRLFFFSTILTIPILLLSPMFLGLFGITASFDGQPILYWAAPILGTILYIFGGRPFLTGGAAELKNRQPGMMLLISLGITVAFFASWAATLGLLPEDLTIWWELALLITIMLLGHWLEMRSLAQTTSALDSLSKLMPDSAEIIREDEVLQITPSELAVSDVMLIRPGGTIPADGVIVAGSASINESIITGESKLIHKGEGDRVIAGTVVADSGLRVRVTSTGDETTLAGIEKLVHEAQLTSTPTQRLADKASGWLFWFALISAALTALVWLIIGDGATALVHTVTVLVIACPHALGLAIPLVVSIATERAAKSGILIKERIALEELSRISDVLFDKTGTLTEGIPEVLDVIAREPFTKDEVITLAASAEQDSEHPLATAIVNQAAKRGLQLKRATDFTSSAAVGVTATIDGTRVSVGGPYLLQEHRLEALSDTATWSQNGSTVLHVIQNGNIIGALELSDKIRYESFAAIRQLSARKVETVMITGDAKPVADHVAKRLGIDHVFAEVRPEDKAAAVKELQESGKTVAMVGDGVNDAPALATADIGIAIGAGTDVAIASADMILASSNPQAVVSAMRLSEAAVKKMKQNLWWAASYNILAVPLAAGVLAPWGISMPMSVGAILMSLSTIIVAANAQLLRRINLDEN